MLAIIIKIGTYIYAGEYCIRATVAAYSFNCLLDRLVIENFDAGHNVLSDMSARQLHPVQRNDLTCGGLHVVFRTAGIQDFF